MQNVSNTGLTNNISYLTNFAPDASNASLTPDMLLLYCSTRLQTIDENIKQYFTEQQHKNKQIRDASKLMSIMQSDTWPNGHMGSKEIRESKDSAFHHANHANKANEILELWRSTDSPDVRAACEDAFKSVTGRDLGDFSGPGVTVSPGDIKAAADAGLIQPATRETWSAKIESLKNNQSDLMKSAELNMIQLQSLVSQRQLAVQLTTQLMQTLNETSKQVVGNLR